MKSYQIQPHLRNQATQDLVAMSNICADTLRIIGAEDRYDGYYTLYYQRTNVSQTHVFSRILQITETKGGFFSEMCEGLKKFLQKSEQYDNLKESANSEKPANSKKIICNRPDNKVKPLVSFPAPCPNDKFFSIE